MILDLVVIDISVLIFRETVRAFLEQLPEETERIAVPSSPASPRVISTKTFSRSKVEVVSRVLRSKISTWVVGARARIDTGIEGLFASLSWEDGDYRARTEALSTWNPTRQRGAP